MRTLVLGGVRCGKSRYAESLAHAQSAAVIVLATATAGDAEMTRRIEAHRARRPAHWRVVEEPLALLGRQRLVGAAAVGHQRVAALGRHFRSGAFSQPEHGVPDALDQQSSLPGRPGAS